MPENCSVKNSVDENSKITEIRLSWRSEIGANKLWVMVEGQDDHKFYRRFFNDNVEVSYCCGAKIGNGKIALEKVVEVLRKESNNIIGIRDADFMRLSDIDSPKNIFLTDFHDLEMTIIKNNDALNSAFCEHLMENHKDSIIDTVLKNAKYLGYIRWYNEINNCELNFKGLKFGYFYKDNNLNIVIQELIDKINERSLNKKGQITIEIMEDFIKNHEVKDLFHLINGHDVVSLISLHINGVTPKGFESSLRLAFSRQHFEGLELYSEIKRFGDANNFKCFKE
jgi:hypothetical protein